MKSIGVIHALVALLVIFSTACEPKKQDDSAEIAKETNDAMIEDRDVEKDADFIVNTISGSYAEIELAKLAQTRSSDSGVKNIASTLKTDHTRLISELKAYADKKGIAVPVAETDEDKGDIRNLAEEKEANKFDEEWCKMLKDRHQKSINKFEARLNKSEDIELKNWVVASLPALRNHLEMLQQNEDRLK
jgi:putative membrane protein